MLYLGTGQDQRRIIFLLFFPIIIIPTLPLPFKLTPSQAIGARGAEWECTILGQQPNSIQFIEPSFRLQAPTYPRHQWKKILQSTASNTTFGSIATEKKSNNDNTIQQDTCYTAKFAPNSPYLLHKGQERKKCDT